MKFDSTAMPILPTQQELNELHDLLLSSTELYQTYAALEHHPRVTGSAKSVELFTSCREQLHQDVALLDKQLETLLTLARHKIIDTGKTDEEQANFAYALGTEGDSQFLSTPDVEPHGRQYIGF